jgi:hypothetical protein
VADKSSQLVHNALAQAAAAGAGVPWHSSKGMTGLFPATALGKQAAQRCRDEGLLSPDADSSATARGRKPSPELCTITEKGLAYLFSQVSPRQVLEDMVRALEAREAQLAELLAAIHALQASLEGLRANAELALAQVGEAAPFADSPSAPAGANGLNALYRNFLQSRSPAPAHSPSPEALDESLLAHLRSWSASGATEDCPLSELFRHARSIWSELTIGDFHDALRRLHERGEAYLHPWTGPLYELPEPPHALLVGHEIAYYASCRS